MGRELLAGALASLALMVAAQPAQAQKCPGFTVGKANSSVYDGEKLPARKVSAEGVTCASVRGLARAFQRGAIELPDGAFSSGSWGPEFQVTYRERPWNCRFWSIGLSGPSYKLRCAWESPRPLGGLAAAR